MNPVTSMFMDTALHITAGFTSLVLGVALWWSARGRFERP